MQSGVGISSLTGAAPLSGAFLTETMRQPSSGIRRLVAQAIRENSLVEQWTSPHRMPNEHNRAASALCTTGA
jgi:hypothetical protein